MHLRISGNLFTESLMREFALITDSATVDVTTPSFDEDQGMFHLPVMRLPLGVRKIRRGWGLLIWRAQRESPAISRIPYMVTVRNVVSANVVNKLTDDRSRVVQLIFGVTFREHEVFAASVDEADDHNPAFEVSLEVTDLDIEIRDIE